MGKITRSSVFSIFSICITIILVVLKNVDGSEPENFKNGITLEVEADNWKNLTGTIPGISSDKHVLYSPRAVPTLDLVCRAQFPIQWNFTGFIHPPEVVKWSPPKRFLDTNTFQIQITILFYGARHLVDAGASTRIACEKVGDPEKSEGVFVFVKGINNQTLLPPKTTTVLDSNLIPCPTKDPTVPTQLYRRAISGKEELVTDSSIVYLPTEGFRSNSFFEGEYSCKQGDSVVTITAERFPSSDGYHFSPKSNMVRAFSDEAIIFTCSSTSGSSVKLVVNSNQESNATSPVMAEFTNSESGQIVKVFAAPVASERLREPILQGKVVCLDEMTSGKVHSGSKIVKKWQYEFVEFVEAPEIYLDNFSRDLHCLSSATSKQIQTVRCKDHMHCNFMSRCLDNVTSCNFESHKQFYSDKNSYCWIRERKGTWKCNTIPYAHLNGIVQCEADGLVKQWDYFVSLDFLEYTNWRDAPVSSLIRMDEVPPILHTNGSTQFFCVAVAYLFADSLSFEMVLRNASVVPLEDNGISVNISNPLEENARKIEEFNIIGVLDILLPVDAVGINCLAPWWNDTAIMRTSRKFETRHLMAPQILNKKDDVTNVTFYNGETHRHLNCHAKGEPVATYQWYFEHRNVSDVFPEIVIYLGPNGESRLEFTAIGVNGADGNKYSGEYRCAAENEFGRAEQIFQLDIADKPIYECGAAGNEPVTASNIKEK